MENRMKVAIYIRVSTDEQAHEGYSLEVQEEFLRKYAQNNGWKLYCPKNDEIYRDDESGYSLNRPALRQLLTDASQKKFDIVLVYKVDRCSRRLQDLLNLVDELESYGIALKSATEPYDTTTSAGKLMFQQLGSFAEFERNRIIERVIPGMKKSLEKGNWLGGYTPYGYTRNKEQKSLDVNPKEAEVIKLIFSQYIQNKTVSYIAGYLTEKGYKSRLNGKFYPSLVCDILKNKLYMGILEWGRRTVDKAEKKKTGRTRIILGDPRNIILTKGKHEPLISQEDFDLVQEKLVENRKGRKVRSNNAGYPLTGILYCGECNHRFRGANVLAGRNTTKRIRYYRCCGNSDHDANCKNLSIRSQYVESVVYEILERIVQHSKVKKGRAKDILRRNVDHTNHNYFEEAKVLKGRLKENKDKQKQLWRSHSDGLMSYEVYKDESITVRAEEQEINKALAKLDMLMIKKERSDEYRNNLRKIISQFGRSKDKMDLRNFRDCLQMVFKGIFVTDKRIVKIDLYEPFDEILAEEGFDTNAVISVKWENKAVVRTGCREMGAP
ncbi:MAG: recombinase family protein [Candidatus Omnitrophica bacterium]|nr:recombinase family protein [Candidatus Omnitrophota bacterium]